MMERLLWLPSVTAFVMATILFFIVGFRYGHFCQKRKPSTAAVETFLPMATGGQSQIPY